MRAQNSIHLVVYIMCRQGVEPGGHRELCMRKPLNSPPLVKKSCDEAVVETAQVIVILFRVSRPVRRNWERSFFGRKTGGPRLRSEIPCRSGCLATIWLRPFCSPSRPWHLTRILPLEFISISPYRCVWSVLFSVYDPHSSSEPPYVAS